VPDLSELLRSPRMVAFLGLLVAIGFSTTGELFLKMGMNRIGHLQFSVRMLTKTFTTWQVIVGFLLFFIGAVFWLWVISRADLSWAYPMLALGYVLVVFESRLLLGESVTGQRWLGTLVVLLGVTIMYGSWKR
jgi:multidrug transporter EmrE-like cation transporter